MASKNQSATTERPHSRDALFDMTGRVALVTGGGSGIGLMIAQALAGNGAKVYITGRSTDKLDSAIKAHDQDLAGSLIPIQADVTSKESIAKLYDEIAAREKCLCILVNNAGISNSKLEMPDDLGASSQSAESAAQTVKDVLFNNGDSTFKDWEDTWRTNVSGAFFTTAAFLPLLQRSTDLHKGWSGTVINVTSISGMIAGSQNHAAYNSSKAGAIHLTRILAKDLAKWGVRVRVNSIAPGIFPSEMTTGDSDQMQKSSIPKETQEGKSLAGRPGRDEDMAAAVLMCVANQFVTGQNIVVDGGLSLALGL